MKYESKITELESRIEKLEKTEHKYKIVNIILLCLYGVFVISLIVLGCVLYMKLKPYKEKIDSLKNLGNDLKTDTIIDGTEDYGDLGDFGNFNDFFSNFFNY